MSEGIDASALWHGIPIFSIRSGRFIEAVGTLHTMRKLRVNNRQITFASENDGYVKLDGTYLNWLFGCPLNAFTPEDFDDVTIDTFFDMIMNYTRNNYVKSWEYFTSFLNDQNAVINSMFNLIENVAVGAPGLEQGVVIPLVPHLPYLSNFSQLVAWIRSMLPYQITSMDTSIMQEEDGNGHVFSIVLDMGTSLSGVDGAVMSFSFVI